MKHLRTILTRFLPTLILGLLLSSCALFGPEWDTCPTSYVEAGTATTREVWRVKRALNNAGIPNYANGNGKGDPDVPYRMYVAPSDKQRAAEIIARTTR